MCPATLRLLRLSEWERRQDTITDFSPVSIFPADPDRVWVAGGMGRTGNSFGITNYYWIIANDGGVYLPVLGFSSGVFARPVTREECPWMTLPLVLQPAALTSAEIVGTAVGKIRHSYYEKVD